MITIQHLGPSPEVQALIKVEVVAHLRAAFAHLPSDVVIIGGDLWRMPLARLDLVRSIWNRVPVLQSKR